MSPLPSPAHLRLYWWLSIFWEKNGYSPTYESMAAKLRISKTQAHKLATELEEYGLIVTHRKQPRGIQAVAPERFLASLVERLAPAIAIPSEQHLDKLLRVRLKGSS